MKTDASPFAVGEILSHKYDNGKARRIHFASLKINFAEQSYIVSKKLALAVVFPLIKFRHYLLTGGKFTLITGDQA